MKKQLFMTVLTAMILLLPSSAQEKLKVGGTTREYKIYVPKDLGTKRPLLISCHGMNQDANYQMGMLDIQSVADTAKFVTVFPEGIDKSWDISGNRDINFVLAIIDAMVEKYDIDPGRVYLSGFSMGGMFTYHAMNKIADRIAAFAPISGYPMGGATAKANVRPIPIIHTHGTSDDVVTFANVKNNLNVWIKHNGCPETAEVTKKYRGAPHITRHVWGPGNDGVEVVLMEMAGKGHWISNDYGVKTGDEIWKFCSRYSIEVSPAEKQQIVPDQRFTSLEEINGKAFAIVNEAEGKAFFGSDAQNLGYDDYTTAFDDGNSGYLFKLEQSTVSGGYLLRLITPDNQAYNIWGKPGYLNAQPVETGWCCFILGLTKGNGEDMENGAVWNIDYVDGKGFSLKNVGTGKYLKDAGNANHDAPTYFSFCTLATTTGISPVIVERNCDGAFYDLIGRRVNEASLRPGIYIRDGRKIAVHFSNPL
jgi:poly(3-hydroxybutyrate) depolymerase